MIPLWLVLLAAAPPAGVDIAFPGPAKLRVEVAVGNEWTTFLDKYFDHLDRDADGSLSAPEAARGFALPLPANREVEPDFEKLDSNKDGKATKDEFRAFYLQAGFAPVVAVVKPPTTELLHLSNALFKHLDSDADGTLSKDELRDAPSLLRRFDENEDEVLTAAELLTPNAVERSSLPQSQLKTTTTNGGADGVLRMAVGKKAGEIAFEPSSDKFKLGSKANEILGLNCRVIAHDSSTATGSPFGTAKEFYLAQFTEALGTKPAVRKADLEADTSLQSLAAMFDSADRDGDRELTRIELQAFLDLVELGVASQVVVAIEDRGANLFDLLDKNADARLDLGELTRAKDLPTLERTKTANQFRLGISRGPVASTFGPVPIPVPAITPAVRPASPTRGPAWFRAMDKNEDGFVSAAEFRGTPALFAKLDADRDGRISSTEADATKP